MTNSHSGRTFAGAVAAFVAGICLVLAVLFFIPLVRGTGDTATGFSVVVVLVGVTLATALAKLAASLLRG